MYCSILVQKRRKERKEGGEKLVEFRWNEKKEKRGGRKKWLGDKVGSRRTDVWWTVSRRKYVYTFGWCTVNKQQKIDRALIKHWGRDDRRGAADISRPGRLINYARHKRTTITGRHVRATSLLSHRSYNNHTLFVRLHADARVRPRALKKIERVVRRNDAE